MQVLKVFIKELLQNYKTTCKNSNCNNQYLLEQYLSLLIIKMSSPATSRRARVFTSNWASCPTSLYRCHNMEHCWNMCGASSPIGGGCRIII